MTSDQLGPLLESVRRRHRLPAMGAAVFTRSDLLGLAAVGVRRVGDPTPATAADRWHIGSDVKAMTAGLLGLLVDRGQLRWEARLDELFPELAPRMWPQHRDLSVRTLLTHRSGLPKEPTTHLVESVSRATPREQREAFVRWVLQQPPASTRGEYLYANSNYLVAGAIAERLFDREYEPLLLDELLTPLGITSGGYGAPGTPGAVDQPWGHWTDWWGFVRRAVAPGPDADNAPIYGPAGRLHLSLADWTRWCQAVMRAARGEASPWSRETGVALVTPIVADMDGCGAALGWNVERRAWAGATRRVLTHAGSNGKWHALAVLAPEADLGVLVVTNQGDRAAERATERAADAVVAALE